MSPSCSLTWFKCVLDVVATWRASLQCGVQWVEIARELGTGRLAGECLARHQQQLAPAGGTTWSAEEDAALLEAMKRHGKNWKVRSSPLDLPSCRVDLKLATGLTLPLLSIT